MKIRLLVAGIGVLLCTNMVMAADAPKKEMSAEEKAGMEAWMKAATPGTEHKGLMSMVGTWDAKVRIWPAPGAPAMESAGTSVNTSVLGGRWIQQTFSGTFMGMPFNGIGYTGYDNIQKAYVGSWMDSSSTSMMTSISTAADGKTITYSSTMQDPMTGKAATGTTRITMVDADHTNMEMWGAGPDGKMYKSMEIMYSRKK